MLFVALLHQQQFACHFKPLYFCCFVVSLPPIPRHMELYNCLLIFVVAAIATVSVHCLILTSFSTHKKQPTNCCTSLHWYVLNAIARAYHNSPYFRWWASQWEWFLSSFGTACDVQTNIRTYKFYPRVIVFNKFNALTVFFSIKK